MMITSPENDRVSVRAINRLNMFNQASNEKNELHDTQKLPLFDLSKQKKTFCAKNGS